MGTININFATTNKAKLAQMRFVVDRMKFPVRVMSAQEVFGTKAAYEEIGDTVEQIALNGALAVAKTIAAPVITQDTDFCVEALNGEPGLTAGGFLKKFGRGEIVRRMENIINRNAIIHSAIAYATPEGASKVFSHTLKGSIAHKEAFGNFPDWIAPTPENSFGGGYNAIFIPDGFDKTLAEIGPADAIPWSYREKNFIDVIHYMLTRY